MRETEQYLNGLKLAAIISDVDLHLSGTNELLKSNNLSGHCATQLHIKAHLIFTKTQFEYIGLWMLPLWTKELNLAVISMISGEIYMYILVLASLALDSKRWAYLISESRSCIFTLTSRGLESKQVCLGFIMRRVVYFPTRLIRWHIPQKSEGKLGY